jgi:nitrate reductase NapA
MTVEEYLKAIEPYTPDKVEELSGVPADKIRLMADLMADPNQRVLSWWCMGMNQHTRGTAINCLVHAIHLLSGQWGRPGAPRSASPASPPPAAPSARSARSPPAARPPASSSRSRCASKAEDCGTSPRAHQRQAGLHTVKMWERVLQAQDRRRYRPPFGCRSPIPARPFRTCTRNSSPSGTARTSSSSSPMHIPPRPPSWPT